MHAGRPAKQAATKGGVEPAGPPLPDLSRSIGRARPAAAGCAGTRLRVALYSHDTMGLGHVRRNLLIAQALVRSPLGANVLMIAGVATARALTMPRGVDCVTLPALYKEADGHYLSRSLELPLRETVAIRTAIISAALAAFRPHLLIVDNVPRGAIRELDPALAELRERGSVRCVLGLRDVLDEPQAVRRDWSQGAIEDAIRDYYDAVWIYGDRGVYDLVREYGLCEQVAQKMSYLGYLDRRNGWQPAGPDAVRFAGAGMPATPFILCMAGGGQDGARLMDALSRAELPPGLNGVVLTGPFMPEAARRTLRHRAARNSRLKVIEFMPEPTLLLSRAARVIAMGGYNTISEILSFGKSALVVPRVTPRREQLIRAERLRALGLLDVLHPDALTPEALSEWLANGRRKVPEARERVDFNGLLRLPGMAERAAAAAGLAPGGARRPGAEALL